jgi:hypothetical protein
LPINQIGFGYQKDAYVDAGNQDSPFSEKGKLL